MGGKRPDEFAAGIVAERKSARRRRDRFSDSSFAPVRSLSPNPAGCICIAGVGDRMAGDHDCVARAGEAAVPRRRARKRSQVVQRVSDGQRLLATGRRPLIVRTTQMEAAVTEDTVPIQNDFPTYEKEKRDRAEP